MSPDSDSESDREPEGNKLCLEPSRPLADAAATEPQGQDHSAIGDETDGCDNTADGGSQIPSGI